MHLVLVLALCAGVASAQNRDGFPCDDDEFVDAAWRGGDGEPNDVSCRSCWRHCTAGQYCRRRGGCTDCDIGWYDSDGDVTQPCQACPAGRTTSIKAAQTADDCDVDVNDGDGWAPERKSTVIMCVFGGIGAVITVIGAVYKVVNRLYPDIAATICKAPQGSHEPVPTEDARKDIEEPASPAARGSEAAAGAARAEERPPSSTLVMTTSHGKPMQVSPRSSSSFDLVFSNKTASDAYCLEMCTQLTRRGLKVWQQQNNIPKDSDNWFKEWFPSANASTKIVCFLTPAYLKSESCMKEFTVAEGLGKLLVVACEPMEALRAVDPSVYPDASNALAYLLGGGQVIFHDRDDVAEEIMKFVPSKGTELQQDTVVFDEAVPEPEPEALFAQQNLVATTADGKDEPREKEALIADGVERHSSCEGAETPNQADTGTNYSRRQCSWPRPTILGGTVTILVAALVGLVVLYVVWPSQQCDPADPAAACFVQRERREPESPLACGPPEDFCRPHLEWAMATGINTHPEWYPSLTSSSSANDFQCTLASNLNRPECKRWPCDHECRHFSGSQLLTEAAWDAQLNTWTGRGPTQRWQLCYSSLMHDATSPAVFHHRCDQYNTTLVIARNSLGYIFGGFSVGSWGLDTCCTTSGNTCHNAEEHPHCFDDTAEDNWLFRLAPGAPQQFMPRPNVHSRFQYVEPRYWPTFGDNGPVTSMGGDDLDLGWNGAPGAHGECNGGTTYTGSGSDVCGGDHWGAKLEVHRLQE